MIVIKLDAIDSTNDFLKKMCTSTRVLNYTVVSAKHQTEGKGQMGSNWISESEKNLIMSMLVHQNKNDIQRLFDFNIMVAVSVYQVLTNLEIPNLSIKWPNDIMSGNKKIGGILIENIIKSNKIDSIVGIGINVNQTVFSDLPQASSLCNMTNKFFVVDDVILKIAENISNNFILFLEDISFFWKKYDEVLFKKNVPMTFKNIDNQLFTGIIKAVSKDGKLSVLLDNGTSVYFEIKQIKLLF